METITPHFCLWIATIIFIILFTGYIYWYDHKEFIDETHWKRRFEKEGLKNIYDVRHDNDSWFYKGKSTCVGYSEENMVCPEYETHCAGGETYGTYDQQVKSVLDSIKNGGTHIDCPLIYEGGS